MGWSLTSLIWVQWRLLQMTTVTGALNNAKQENRYCIYTKDHQGRWSRTKYSPLIFNENLCSCCSGTRSSRLTPPSPPKKLMTVTFLSVRSCPLGYQTLTQTRHNLTRWGLLSLIIWESPARHGSAFWRYARTFNRNGSSGKPCSAARWQGQRRLRCRWSEQRLLNMRN